MVLIDGTAAMRLSLPWSTTLRADGPAVHSTAPRHVARSRLAPQ